MGRINFSTARPLMLPNLAQPAAQTLCPRSLRPAVASAWSVVLWFFVSFVGLLQCALQARLVGSSELAHPLFIAAVLPVLCTSLLPGPKSCFWFLNPPFYTSIDYIFKSYMPAGLLSLQVHIFMHE